MRAYLERIDAEAGMARFYVVMNTRLTGRGHGSDPPKPDIIRRGMSVKARLLPRGEKPGMTQAAAWAILLRAS